MSLALPAVAQPPSSAEAPRTGELTAKKQLTLEQMFAEQTGMATAPSGMQWSPDGSKLSYLRRGREGEQQSLNYFDPATGKTAVLISSEKLGALAPAESANKDDRQRDNRARYSVAAYHWSPDSKSILFDANGRLWLVDVAKGTGRAITSGDDGAGDPKFTPDGAAVSYVRKHDLYVQPLSGGDPVAVTKNGSPDLFNGEVDWVYSEELDVRSNYAWSPDSRQVLYLQMNEAAVLAYPIVDWIQTHPKADPMKYPKAGDPNPGVRLGVTGLDGQTNWIALGGETDIYIPRFGWVKPGLAWAMVLNRQQNRQDLYLIDAASGRSKLMLREKDDFYIELRSDTVKFLKTGGRFLWSSWRDGHTHLYLYSFDEKEPLAADAKLIRQITRGDWEFSSVKAVDEKSGLIYFSANAGDVRQSNVYSVKLDGSELTRITPEPGSHDVNISPGTSSDAPRAARYYWDRWSSLTVPAHLQICALEGGAAKHACHEVWRSTALDQYATLAPQFVDFKAEDGTLLHGVIVLPPPNAPKAPSGKYPLIMSPYGGPGSMTVRDGYGAISVFDQVLASRGFAVLKVDNRGMAGRGRKFATVTYKNLGEIELRDQLAALDQALTRFPQLDANRLGWWGWSYGGSMTLIAMTQSDRFKVGVAVAPVTDWHLYDSIYTERYMGLPQENAAGYDKASLVKAAGKLRGNLLIIHGTSDDNVHMQNTLQFINELINNGVQFDMQLYPQKTHSISGRKTRMHLYTRILSQFENGLMK